MDTSNSTTGDNTGIGVLIDQKTIRELQSSIFPKEEELGRAAQTLIDNAVAELKPLLKYVCRPATIHGSGLARLETRIALLGALRELVPSLSTDETDEDGKVFIREDGTIEELRPRKNGGYEGI